MKKSLFLILLIGAIPDLHAQMWEVGAGLGGMNYKGDVMPKFKPFVVGPGANAFVRLNYSRSLSLKANAVIGKIHGSDAAMNQPFHRARDASFNTSIIELGGQIEYNFMNFRTSASRIVNNWSPYVFGGAASTRYSFNLKKIDIQKSSGVITRIPINYANSNSRNSWILGIGFKKELSPHWNWGVEFGTRWVNDDALDGFGYDSKGEYDSGIDSSTVIDIVVLNELKRQVPGTRAKDMYYYTNISISYLFYKVHCPPRR